MLDVECAGLSAAQVLNRGAYVVPVGAGRFRVGATYRWPPFADGPTAAGREELAAPADRHHRPAVCRGGAAGRACGPPCATAGRCWAATPPCRALSFCGGYGSKGVMLAPRLAALLADWLAGQADLWPEVSLQRYSALYSQLHGLGYERQLPAVDYPLALPMASKFEFDPQQPGIASLVGHSYFRRILSAGQPA